MLRFLRIENWKSFYEPVEFTMVATREQRHGQRLARVGRSRLLPVTAIYGANAAGKSTLVDGLDALRSIVVEARSPSSLPRVIPHLLRGRNEPTVFMIEFVAPVPRPNGGEKDQVFLYELAVDRKQIHRETLIQVKGHLEDFLFERDEHQIQLYGPLEKNDRARAHATVVAPNQTLLDALGSDVAGPVAAARDWFEQQLTVIYPYSRYAHLPARITADALFAEAMNSGLTKADTGISQLRLEEMRISALAIPAKETDRLVEFLRNAGGSYLLSSDGDDYAVLSLDDNGDPVARRLVADHCRETGPGSTEHIFTLPLREESDGTRRFMNLMPILFQLREEDSRRVFVVDELENSMHPKLTENLIAAFLDELGSQSRRQLIFTTHEIQLMRSNLLRRDEIWLTEKIDGQSELTRVSDFAEIGVRKDADLLGHYMSGRIGGIPR